MRRTAFVIIATALVIAACGSDSDSSADTADGSSGSEAELPADTADSDDAGGGQDTSDTSSGSAPTPGSEAPTTTENPDKPEVAIPDELPTELERNVLEEGTGDGAEVGDTVIVNYVGVRSEDGVEFDSSYGRQPFPVSLGSGSVIQGWDEGLVGAKTGERIQLDIPSDMAYGDQARGEVIRENESLSFVIDVLAVVEAVDPADAPTEPGVALSTGEGAVTTEFEDLEVGDGPELEAGQTALIRYVMFRGDNGAILEAQWGEPAPVPYVEGQYVDGQYVDGLPQGLYVGLEGMKVGGSRAITMPPEEFVGEQGNPQGGLPADTDVIFVIDLLGTY